LARIIQISLQLVPVSSSYLETENATFFPSALTTGEPTEAVRK
jgi:hypothetical protein